MTKYRALWPVVCLGLIAAIPSARPQSTCSQQIGFDVVPPSGRGPDSRGNIGGKICGLPSIQGLKVVVYAHTDEWYVQPLIDAPFTDIAPDGMWSTWTHLGSRYAVLLVRPSFSPPAKVVSLPQIGGDVVARAEVPARE